jgi:hypothetical protein
MATSPFLHNPQVLPMMRCDNIPKKLNLFNHEKRLKALETAAALVPENKLLGFVRTYGAICGIWAFVIVLIFLVLPALR